MSRGPGVRARSQVVIAVAAAVALLGGACAGGAEPAQPAATVATTTPPPSSTSTSTSTTASTTTAAPEPEEPQIPTISVGGRGILSTSFVQADDRVVFANETDRTWSVRVNEGDFGEWALEPGDSVTVDVAQFPRRRLRVAFDDGQVGLRGVLDLSGLPLIPPEGEPFVVDLSPVDVTPLTGVYRVFEFDDSGELLGFVDVGMVYVQPEGWSSVEHGASSRDPDNSADIARMAYFLGTDPFNSERMEIEASIDGWTLWVFEQGSGERVSRVSVAVQEIGGLTMFIELVSAAAEHDHLRDAVLLPAMAALEVFLLEDE